MKRIGKAAALGPLDDNMEPDEEVKGAQALAWLVCCSIQSLPLAGWNTSVCRREEP